MIIDFLLEDENGAEIVKKIRKGNGISRLPVIMLSAHPNAELQAKEAGVEAFLAKPFEIDELLEKIKNLTI